ncbi:T-cell ecto-ADP-ribosyltransferase 1 [Xiphias gladius]|uniref:T-cell ecto-ADP-ribosyltransferase 1 n=1 Tax=Xiphias gladius TaxID=8245 RepID=UPI001A983A5F|nr:T-cell ecto-ADP-ribosyltransferase 1 [Xiphias gladius]XP_040003234.1 T-cell ecto-ADP-ribosyltransferase 1 [Xiphias gladius]
MWDRRELLFAAVVFAALYYRVAAEGKTPLDMAVNAVDGLYQGCREKAMRKVVHSDLLGQELNRSKEFQEAWSAGTKCSKLNPGGRKEHATALYVYANGNEPFIKTFNREVETMGVNLTTYENNFHFKSFHFLLMDSMKRQETGNCKAVYVFPETEYTAEKGSKVRLGRFIIADLSFDELSKSEDLDGQVVLNITSCFFANLVESFCEEVNSNVVLLSPSEVFTVESINYRVMGEFNFTEIILNHTALESKHQCSILSRSPADVSTQWLVLVLAALSLFFYTR